MEDEEQDSDTAEDGKLVAVDHIPTAWTGVLGDEEPEVFLVSADPPKPPPTEPGQKKPRKKKKGTRAPAIMDRNIHEEGFAGVWAAMDEGINDPPPEEEGGELAELEGDVCGDELGDGEDVIRKQQLKEGEAALRRDPKLVNNADEVVRNLQVTTGEPLHET